MKRFGKKGLFAIDYEKIDDRMGSLELWVSNIPVCCAYINGIKRTYTWNLTYIIEWFEENKEIIMQERGFPLPISVETSIEFYNKRDLLFDSNDLEELSRLHKIVQEWCFRHDWFVSRDGSYLASVFFRRVEDNIEIVWDNSKLYDDEGISFVNPKGLGYVDIQTFNEVIEDFLKFYHDNN